MTWPQQVQSITCLATTSGGGFGSTTNELKIMNGLVTCYPVGGWIKWCVRKCIVLRGWCYFQKVLPTFNNLIMFLFQFVRPPFIRCNSNRLQATTSAKNNISMSSCLCFQLSSTSTAPSEKKVGVGGRRHSLKRRMAKTLIQKSGRDDDDIIRRPPNASWATIFRFEKHANGS